jgi:glc operon protein GlcG
MLPHDVALASTATPCHASAVIPWIDTMRTKPVLVLEDAKALMEFAEKEASSNGWKIVVAILDDGGHLVALHRMDGTRPGNPDIAIQKARTSAMTLRPSEVWERRVLGGRVSMLSMPLLTVQGGLPIFIDGDCIGAIGISGVQSHEDQQVAMAAIRSVFPNATITQAGEEND